MNKNIKINSLALLIALMLSACVSLDSSRDWPNDVPERQFFVDAYIQQGHPNPHSAELEKHLVWIKRFYRGSFIYPLGWNRMTELVLDSLMDEADKQNAQRRLFALGKRISVEWAQENEARLINSKAVAAWGDALKTSAERNEQLEFITRVEQDVDALLTETLHKREINAQRYYPPDDYDNF